MKRRIVLLGIFLCLGAYVLWLFLWSTQLRPLNAELLDQLPRTEAEIATFLGGSARNYGTRLPIRQKSNMVVCDFGDGPATVACKEWAAGGRAIVVGFDNTGHARGMMYYEFTETPWQMIQRLLHLD